MKFQVASFKFQASRPTSIGPPASCILHLASCKKGFTLIELIIAITIVSMIMAIILGGMRLSIRAWEVGEGRVEVYQTGMLMSPTTFNASAMICVCFFSSLIMSFPME